MGSFPPSSGRTGRPTQEFAAVEHSEVKTRSQIGISVRHFSTIPTIPVDLVPDSSNKLGVLIVSTGAEAGRVIAISDSELVTIGRSRDCTIRLRDESLSRTHMRVARIKGRYFVADARSKNGSYRNGSRLRTSEELEDGDRLRLGATTVLWFKLVDGVERAALERAYDGSSRDGLTGLYNRRYLDTALGAELKIARREDLPLSLIMLDVDFFKRINDGWGHLVGDGALRWICALVSQEIRPTDIAARFGGDELLVMARATTLRDAHYLADRLRTIVEKGVLIWEGTQHRLTLSLGVASLACCNPSATVEDFLTLVDRRLMEAKKRRNCVVAG